tara:strand:+ start:6696 stop:6818 length:123 start_codon:yes stop_codon:yes gene_type:complete
MGIVYSGSVGTPFHGEKPNKRRKLDLKKGVKKVNGSKHRK